MKYITKALLSLGVDNFVLDFDGEIATEEDFNAAFTKYNDGDVQVKGIEQLYPITWEDIANKAKELKDQEPLEILRKQRNRLLAETDWWVLSDRTPTNEQIVYRQALRDITNTYTSIDNVIWPTKP